MHTQELQEEIALLVGLRKNEPIAKIAIDNINTNMRNNSHLGKVGRITEHGTKNTTRMEAHG